MTPSPAHPIAHTQPATQTELSAVLALFPKCTACGAQLTLDDAIEADPKHWCRLRHSGPCTPPLAA